MAPKAGSRNNRQLTPKQRAFCEHYVKHWNGAQAVIDAGMTEKRTSARTIASHYLDNKNVMDFINKRGDKLVNKTTISGERVINELKASGFFDPIDIFNEDGTIKDIKDIPEQARRAIASIEVQETFEFDHNNHVKTKTGEIKKIRFWDKIKSNELIGKHIGMFVEKSKVEINAPELTETLGKLLGATIK